VNLCAASGLALDGLSGEALPPPPLRTDPAISGLPRGGETGRDGRRLGGGPGSPKGVPSPLGSAT
jgi:hypothetical protein